MQGDKWNTVMETIFISVYLLFTQPLTNDLFKMTDNNLCPFHLAHYCLIYFDFCDLGAASGELLLLPQSIQRRMIHQELIDIQQHVGQWSDNE